MSLAFLLTPCPAHARILRVGIYQNHPKVFTDEENIPRGIFVDLIDEIAMQEDWEIEYVPGTWNENLARLKNNEIDMFVDVSFSQERADQFKLSDAVLESWLDVYAKKEARIRSIHDLHMKRIAVLAGSIQEKYLQTEVKTNLKINFTLVPSPDYQTSVEMVKSGRADLMVASRFFSFSPDRDQALEPAHVIFRPEHLHFAFHTNVEAGIVRTINQHIASMKNHPNSRYYQSLKRWLKMHPRVLIPDYIKYILAVIAALLVIIGLFAFFLRRQVAARTIALRETERLLKESQAIAGLGGWEYDVHSHRVKWTDEMYSICGVDRDYDPNDVERTFSLYAPQSAPTAKKAFHGAVKKGEPYDLELELIRWNGEHIWVRSMGKPVIENGKIVRVTGNIMNITERRRAEEERRVLEDQMIQAQKMESIGRLAGGIAHDFNNMLGVILAYAELLLLKMDPKNPFYAYPGEIMNAVKHSASLVRQLLAFARRQPISPISLDLNETMAGMLKMLQRLIGEDVELVWHPGKGLWNIKIDPSQIDQILANLCVNARDAITGVGRIVITTGNVVVKPDTFNQPGEIAPGEYVMLSVKDSGFGMNQEIIAHLFEPFFTTKEIGKGTGLGLSTVYGIVKQNDGFINVSSAPGRGTTFEIYFPRQARQANHDRALPLKEGSLNGHETLLLVEDNPAILEAGRRMLQALGYNVLSAAKPGDAVNLAQQHAGKIHLLISDVVMPEMNGKDLAAIMKTHQPAIETLFISGYPANVIGSHGVLEPGIHFLQKPFPMKDLAAKVREVLQAEHPDGATPAC